MINEQESMSDDDVADPFNADSDNDPNYSPSQGEQDNAESRDNIVSDTFQQAARKNNIKRKSTEKVSRQETSSKRKRMD